tara:strand:+ start:13 stop:738 length:726 start_codon:yes stop_codon:yes gene_type:complete
MKKIYLSLFTFCCLSIGTTAQNNAAISACLNGSDVSISFDNALNCAAAPGSFSGMASIGFHSGADSWSTIIAWDDATAVQATNDGSDVFTFTMDPATYYGVAASTVHFVYNMGPTDPAGPWASEGKDDDGAGGCADFLVDVASLTPCSTTGFNEVTLNDVINVAPNPANEMTNFNIILRNNKEVSIQIFDITGKMVDNINRANYSKGVHSISYNISNLTNGIYIYQVITGKEINSGKLIVK